MSDFSTTSDGQVTLVIPARNAARVLRPCLDAVVLLVGHDGLREIIVIDDGSTDDTADIARTYPVRLIQGPGGGPGAARNLGWRAAQTPQVWFIDCDCVAEPDALRLLLPHLADGEVAGVGGSYGNMRPDSLLACLIHEEIIQRHLAMPQEVNFLASFNVVYRREVLEQLGGFDERHTNGPGRAGAEDAELAFRLRAAGYRLRFERSSRVNHFHPTRLWNYLKTQARHGYYRVMLYRLHPQRMQGDSYSNWADHAQPPLAMVLSATLPLLAWSLARWVPLAILALLIALQFPMTIKLVRRTGRLRYAWFAPMSLVRAFARGFGLVLGVLSTGRVQPEAVQPEPKLRPATMVGDKLPT
jgi:glycosyltransferase involved in cell wall biosynthesis